MSCFVIVPDLESAELQRSVSEPTRCRRVLLLYQIMKLLNCKEVCRDRRRGVVVCGVPHSCLRWLRRKVDVRWRRRRHIMSQMSYSRGPSQTCPAVALGCASAPSLLPVQSLAAGMRPNVSFILSFSRCYLLTSHKSASFTGTYVMRVPFPYASITGSSCDKSDVAYVTSSMCSNKTL